MINLKPFDLLIFESTDFLMLLASILIIAIDFMNRIQVNISLLSELQLRLIVNHYLECLNLD